MYGGSYGGFMTLMALFTEPKYFGAGAALRPRHRLGALQPRLHGAHPESPAGRHAVVPPVVADLLRRQGLEDPLLMLHGMVDTNVHFEDIVRLTQRLIELGKTDW